LPVLRLEYLRPSCGSVTKTIKHQEPCDITLRDPLEAETKIVFSLRRKFAVTGIGSPDAAWNVTSCLLAPDGPDCPKMD
jgi:hypothetical protein